MNLSHTAQSNKFKKLNLENPEEIIKNRILLEAKRLLKNSGKSIKDGSGHFTTQSSVLNKTQYSFNSRFAEGIGTNP
ncbi:hypothetical protein U3A58_09675 [Algoriphagus sp. C2-6-M1]|nr:hypothetical protein [Algoriphagus sp. C2-6-M1]MEB2780664.1 hypothetical protein [Algoriphagus sp. C2-6-M1]